MKERSVFFPEHVLQTVQTNIGKYGWAKEIRQSIVEQADVYAQYSEDGLWGLMFGNTIYRSWMVWSNGYCPSCKGDVPMYGWIIDPFAHPWKTRCPHCRELFPKNDFYKYYKSGLNKHGVFERSLADQGLLFNEEHPDPANPLHRFGVDDGYGYGEQERARCWRFIGCYLIYGQWKKLIIGGVKKLADAYVVTGNSVYARRAAILLDRIADLLPTFDFYLEGIVYEKWHASEGYVSYAIDSTTEICDLVLAYDQIYEAVKHDAELVTFLSGKAEETGLENKKASFADIKRNIEERILLDVLNRPHKIRSNPPHTEYTIAVIKTILGGEGSEQAVRDIVDGIIKDVTKVDGMQGEKGVAGYTAMTTKGLALMLSKYTSANPDFMQDMLNRNPQLHQTFRFHIDMWCLDMTYYPNAGDGGYFAKPLTQYPAVDFVKNPGVHPSMYSFLWKLYELTGDTDFVRVLYRANEDSNENLPYDLTFDDPDRMQQQVKEIIDREGAIVKVESLNKQKYGMAILRSGENKDARALWVDYAYYGGHAQSSAMTIGLFAKGLDLLPDFGYPPVMFGSWVSKKALWYRVPAAHNTMAVDGEYQTLGITGKTKLWAVGDQFQAIRVSGPELVLNGKGKQFERTAALVDISARDCYVIDVFRVVGGKDHAKFTYGHFGEIATHGITLQPADEYGHDTMLRSFQADTAPQPGWSVDWKIRDEHGVVPDRPDIHMRYTDLTYGASAYIAEAWICYGMRPGDYTSKIEHWIPCAMSRRQSDQADRTSLASAFVSVIEPYEGDLNIAGVRRLPLQYGDGSETSDFEAAVEVALADGRTDLHISADAEDPLGRKKGTVLHQSDWDLELDGEYAMVRAGANGVERIALCKARSLRIGTISVRLKAEAEFIELARQAGPFTVVSGDADWIDSSSGLLIFQV